MTPLIFGPGRTIILPDTYPPSHFACLSTRRSAEVRPPLDPGLLPAGMTSPLYAAQGGELISNTLASGGFREM